MELVVHYDVRFIAAQRPLLRMILPRGCKYTMNSKGTKTEPRGPPRVRGAIEEVRLLM